MDKHRAAPSGDARPHVVADFDNEIIEMIVAPEPVAGRIQPVSRYGDCSAGRPDPRTRRRADRSGARGAASRAASRGRRATTAARDGTGRAGSRRRPPACSPGCRRGRAPPETRGVRRAARHGCESPGARAYMERPQRLRPIRCLSRIESIAAGACALSPECSTSRNGIGVPHPGGAYDQRPQNSDRR